MARLQIAAQASGQSLRTLQGHNSWVSGVAITSDGRRAVSASWAKTLRVWDLESGKELALLTADSATTCCAVSLDGRTIVAGDASGRVHFLRLVEADKTDWMRTTRLIKATSKNCLRSCILRACYNLCLAQAAAARPWAI